VSDAPSPRPLMSNGVESMHIDEDDDVGLIKIARVGSELVIVERYGDPAKGTPHRFMCYRVKQRKAGELFQLDPRCALFVRTRRASTRRRIGTLNAFTIPARGTTRRWWRFTLR
jgi:hypothetical protein